MAGADLDARVRLATGEFVEREAAARGGLLPWPVLVRGFEMEGRWIPLASMQGIFKPAVLLDVPLSIRTTPPAAGRVQPYDDGFEPDGRLLRYHYRAAGPDHPDNRGLRLALERQSPLLYLHGVIPGQYLPAWPVFIVDDRPAERVFRIVVDDPVALRAPPGAAPPGEPEGRRAYVTALTRQRLHQQGFRIRVLQAYRACCAVCRLGQRELIEAAHILPDGHPRGIPVVPNGLALCGLHHAAFDRHVLGITPDRIVELRQDILDEEDGPMLLHGLQGFHRQPILLPRRPDLHPDREFLAERYEMFRRAS